MWVSKLGWKRVSFIGKQRLDKLLMLEADHVLFCKLVAEDEAGEARREATSSSKAG